MCVGVCVCMCGSSTAALFLRLFVRCTIMSFQFFFLVSFLVCLFPVSSTSVSLRCACTKFCALFFSLLHILLFLPSRQKYLIEFVAQPRQPGTDASMPHRSATEKSARNRVVTAMNRITFCSLRCPALVVGTRELMMHASAALSMFFFSLNGKAAFFSCTLHNRHGWTTAEKKTFHCSSALCL